MRRGRHDIAANVGAAVDFFACTAAVNQVLGRSSTRHGGQPCPASKAHARDGRAVLAYCDRGCFDEAADLLDDVLRRLRRGGRHRAMSVHAYARRVAATALGDLHRDRRSRLGLPQRPERVADAEWALRLLPDPADRSLLAHMLTWLGSDAPALDGAGWPVEAWAARYGRSVGDMTASVDRVVDSLRTADPRRYARYIAGPLAAKPHHVALFGAIDDIARHAIRHEGDDLCLS